MSARQSQIAGTERLDRLADAFAGLASRAGCAILAVYDSDFAMRQKPDASPVCEADEAAEIIIVEGLKAILPGVPVIAEEQVSKGQVPDIGSGSFLLVDPLDGTVEFADRNGEFTVNIALVEAGLPVCGIVYAPLDGSLYLGGETARRADLIAGQEFDARTARLIRARRPAKPMAIVMSRSHRCPRTEAWARDQGEATLLTRGSALKFGLIAEGLADAYPRFTPTMEWDTAAGHAVILAAGGSVRTPEGQPFTYGKQAQGFRNGPFIARGLAGI